MNLKKDHILNLIFIIIFINIVLLGITLIDSERDKFIRENPKVQELEKEYKKLKYQKDIDAKIKQLEYKINRLKEKEK